MAWRLAAPKIRRATSRMRFSAWIVPVGRYSRPPGARHPVSRMLSSIAAGSSAPVGPPACPSGNQPETRAISSGIPETSPMMTSACWPLTGSRRFPTRNSTRSLRPRRSALSSATSIAGSDRSQPITRPAPSRAATKESTPLPQPTSITVSPCAISRASAIERLVWLGAKTPGLTRMVNGPVRPLHSISWGAPSEVEEVISSLMVRRRESGSQPALDPGCGDLGVLTRLDLASLDRRGVFLCLAADLGRVHTEVARGISGDPPSGPPQELHRPVAVPPQQVDVSSPELREPLEELGVVGVAGLLPCRLPGLVCREEPPGVEVLAAQAMVLLQREVVEVLQVQAVLGIPRLRPAELVSGAPRLVARGRRPPGLALCLGSHGAIVARPLGSAPASPCTGAFRPIPWNEASREPMRVATSTEIQQTPAPGEGPPPAEAGSERMPPWIPRLLLLVVFTAFAAYAALLLVRRLRDVIFWLITALLLSFALEPAVNWLVKKRGWPRGAATGVVLFGLAAILLVTVAAMVPLVINQVQQLVTRVPSWLEEASVYTKRWFNIELTGSEILDRLRNADLAVSRIASSLASVGAFMLSLLIQVLTIGLFTFYLVADGPRVRRAVCSVLPPRRQREILDAWEIAIEKTGGFLYSRLLLAAVSAFFGFWALFFLKVPFALPLALWMGLVSQFIPVVGTYIGATVLTMEPEPVVAPHTRSRRVRLIARFRRRGASRED